MLMPDLGPSISRQLHLRTLVDDVKLVAISNLAQGGSAERRGPAFLFQSSMKHKLDETPDLKLGNRRSGRQSLRQAARAEEGTKAVPSSGLHPGFTVPPFC